jgi:AsmA protein
MKRFWMIAGIVVGVVIVVVLLVPLFINVDSFRPDVEKKLSEALGRQVHIGKIEASVLSGGASANNISILDDPAFNKGPFLQASSLQIGIEWMPLIFSRQFKVNSLTVKRPDIVLLKNTAGRWNYSSLGNSTPSKAKQQPSSGPAPDFSVAKFEIQDGKIRVGQVNGHSIGKEHVYDKVNLLARNISSTSVIPFTLSAVTPGGGSLELEGKAGPLNSQDSAKTPLDARVNLEHADLSASGLFDPGSGVGGVLDFNGTVKSDGRHLVSSGKAKADNLKVVKGGSPARRAVTLDYTSNYGLDSDSGTVNANVHTGNSLASANGTLSSRGEETLAHLKVQGRNMAVNDIEGLLPAFGVNLPSGASLQGGTINTALNADGPLDRLVITGPVEMTGTRLSGFNLGSKLSAIAALAGMKPSTDTLIQTFSSSLRVAPEGIRADNILLDVPSMGQLTGDGLISNNQSLDFKMLLKVVNSGTLLGQLASISGGGQNKGIPFLVRGTSSSPAFMPAVGGIATSLVGLQGGSQSSSQPGQQGLGGILGNFLNKKKKP